MTSIDVLHATHGRSVFRLLMKLTHGDKPTAEDLFQETMLRAWKHSDNLPEHETNQRKWLYAVARRIVIDTVRSKQVRPTETPVLDLEWVSRSEDTTDVALANQSIVHAFGRLSEAHRTVLTQLYFQGRPVDEVAEALRVPVGTVKSRAHYALRALKSNMAAVD